MRKYCTLALTAAAALFSKAVATDCNPLTNTTCDPDTGLSTSTYSVDFTAGADTDNWESVGGGDVNYTSSGAEFTISAKGDSPTLQTAWYIFFGRVEIHMKSASGTGIVSSIVLLSDDADEVDWEWLGGYNDEVQTNYFGKGISTSSGRSSTESVDDAQGTSHNYTLYWTKDALSWYLDGSLLRTRTYSEAEGGDEYPQTPSRVKIGIWAGGDSDNSEGTISWAGGETDYDEGPFTMIAESVDITNFNPGSSYTYTDQTGDYTSIDIDTSSDSDSDTTTTTTSAKSTTKAATSSTKAAQTSAAAATSAVATTTAAAVQTTEAVESPAATQTSSSGSGSGDYSNDGDSQDGSDDSDSGSDSNDNSGYDDSGDNSGDSSSDDSSDCGCEDGHLGWHSGHSHFTWSEHSSHGGGGIWKSQYSEFSGKTFRHSTFREGGVGGLPKDKMRVRKRFSA